MDTTFGCSVAEFLFENNTVVSTSNTHNTIKQQSNNNNNHNNIHNHNNHNNKRFKFKPFHNSLEPFSTTTTNNKQQQQQQQQSQTIVNPDLIKLNLNNKKDFKKKLLNFDINRNFEDIYWLSLKDKPQQLQQQQQKEIKFDYLSVTTPSTLINQQQQQRSSANSSNNNNNNNSPNSGDSTYRKQQQPQIPTKLSPTTTTTVLVDLNRQSINLPLTPIKEDLFKNRYFENYLLNRKITNNNTNTFHSNSTNHLSTIYFKPSFNLLDQHQSESILTFNESFKLNKLQKLDAIEGSKIFINKTLTTNIVVEQSIEQSTPRKTNNNNNNNIMPNTTPTTTTTSTPTTILTSTSPSNLIKSNLYKIKEDDIISSLLASTTTTTPTNDNNTTTKKQEDQLIQTQFRLKPLITSNNNNTNNTNKPVNHNLNEEINEHDFDLYDKKLQKNFNKTIIKQDFLNKPITKPQQFSKLINHRNNNNNNNEEINKNLNENSEFFTAKATSINRSITPTSNNSTTTTTTAAATMNTINSKTKLARIVKTEDESFLNRKTKPYIYNNNNNNNISKKPTIDENHSSEEETDNQKLKLNNKSTSNNIQKYNEDYFITRVESPHKLGKSMPDCYMFVGSSSIQVNSNANNLLNQQFQLFQSQMFDNKQ
jgi:hypothetical protein